MEKLALPYRFQGYIVIHMYDQTLLALHRSIDVYLKPVILWNLVHHWQISRTKRKPIE